MMMHFNNPEAIVSIRLPYSKKKYVSTIKEEYICQQTQKRILLLEAYILSIILNNTSLIHSEFRQYAIMRSNLALTYRCNGLLLYRSVELQYNEQTIIINRNPIENRTLGAIEIHVGNIDEHHA